MIAYYRVISTGQWCGPSYENGAALPSDIALTLGVDADDIEIVEVENGDPRTGDLLNDPNVAIETTPEPQIEEQPVTVEEEPEP